jgi:alkylation response protein AidB-like acyl-CoA dehydrogenase
MFDFMLSPQERELKREVRRFVRDEVAPELLRRMDRDEVSYPRDFVAELGRKGLLGLRFPTRYGGRAMCWVAEVAAAEEIGCLGMALGCAFAMPSIVGEALHVFGSDWQKDAYLRPLIKGKRVAAEALTEPRGGSDFFGAMTRADRDGDHFVLNGMKRFVVGAQEADFFLVYCRTDFDSRTDPRKRISLFLVDRGPGVKTEYLYGLMGCRGGGTGRVVFRDARVPRENLLGRLHGGERCFQRMMIPERLTSAAGCLGVWGALDLAVRYSARRRAFGREIRNYQAISFKVADAITRLDAARALTCTAARAVDAGHPDARRLVSEAKRFATEGAWEVVNDAMQIMGGIGYTDVYPVERILRDIRLGMIWTGTSEIMNLLIQHDYYRLVLDTSYDRRRLENDALHPDDNERCYTDGDMERVFGDGLRQGSEFRTS